MTRSTRLEPVRKVVDNTERRRAEDLAESERRLTECELKLRELEQYREDYRNKLNARSSDGIDSAELRDYQIFLARLTEAIRLQTQMVTAARGACELERGRWQDAARRRKAIDHVVDHWQAEERRESERREQRDTDEHAQRAAYRKER